MTDQTHNYTSYLFEKVDCFDIPDSFNKGWVFRGHKKACWNLSSSLERETGRLGNTDRAAFEAVTLDQVKLAASYGETGGIDSADYFSWLALLQHHGCKTRLLDFTESFYVALYFAVQDCPATDSAVWAIATGALDARIAEVRAQGGFVLTEEDIARRLVNNAIEYPDRYKGEDTLAITYAKPSRLNQRLIAQQGLFLCPLNLNNSFMENLTKGLGLTGTKKPVKRLSGLNDLRAAADQEKVVKFCIPQRLHQMLLFHLRKMNITDATLFPGFDGFARSINYFAMGRE